MKKMRIAGLILTLFLVSVIAAYAANDPSLQKSRLEIGNKAERGVKNVLFGWTELPKRIVDLTKEKRNPIYGIIVGGFQGTCKGLARTVSGVVDVATCTVRSSEPAFVKPDMDM